MITNYAESLNKLREFFNDSLSELNVPELTFIENPEGLFSANQLLNGLTIGNDNLISINFPNLEQQPYYLVTKNLQSINLDRLRRAEFGFARPNNGSVNDVLSIRFLQNTKLRTLDLPNFIGPSRASNAIPNDNQITNADADKASFWNNYWLEDVSFGNSSLINSSNSYFNGFWFRNNYFLTSLRLNYPYVIKMVGSPIGFNTTPLRSNGVGYIYVPDNLSEEYKKADGWYSVRSQIKKMSEYEILHNQWADTISDDWTTIINNCNSNNVNKYSIGDTKTLTIDKIPVQMVIVGKNVDELANSNNKASLTWLMKTISLFDLVSTYEIYDTTKLHQYTNALSFKEFLNNNIFEKIEDSNLKNNIKSVKKTSKGFDAAGNSGDFTSNEKIWPPAAYEVGLATSSGSLIKYPYFTETNPVNYSLGLSGVKTIDNTNISITLRDNTGKSNYLDIARSYGESQQTAPYMERISNDAQRPFLVFGFCT